MGALNARGAGMAAGPVIERDVILVVGWDTGVEVVCGGTGIAGVDETRAEACVRALWRADEAGGGGIDECEAWGLGKLPGRLAGLGNCEGGTELLDDAAAAACVAGWLVRAVVEMGVARELGDRADLVKRPDLLRICCFLLMQGFIGERLIGGGKRGDHFFLLQPRLGKDLTDFPSRWAPVVCRVRVVRMSTQGKM